MSQYSHPRKQFFPLLIAFAIIALLFGMWTQHNSQPQKKTVALETGTILPAPHPVSSFNLTGTDNKPFTNQNLQGKWSMIFYGFTKCPMLCPTTLTTLNDMYQRLEKDQVSTMPQVVFISLDPERDTPAAIQKYLKSFNPHFVGATGKKAAIDKMTGEMNVIYEKAANPNGKDKGDYLVNHSGTILVINPQGKLFAVFTTPHNAEKLSHDIRTIEANFS